MNEYHHPNEPTALEVPRDRAAERAVVGALMLDPAALPRVLGVVKADDFSEPAIGTVFEIILELSDQDRPFDPLTVADAWKSRGLDPAEIGNGADLIGLANDCPSIHPVRSWAESVADKARLRNLIDVGVEISELARTGEASAEAIERAEALVFNERKNGNQAKKIVEIGVAFADGDASRKRQAMRPYKRNLAEITGPACSTDFVVLAGRPGTGKTAKSLEWLLRLAIEGVPVLMFSLEMDRDQLFARLVAIVTGVHIPRDPREREEHHEKAITDTNITLKKAPLYIDDLPDLSPRSLRWKVRQYRKRYGVRFVVLDYLQLLQADDRRQDLYTLVTEASRACKSTAKESDVTLVALSQMNREADKTNRKPKVSDLRQSGQIEADADLICFLWSPTKPEERGNEWLVENIVAKNRHGRCGEISEVFDPSRMSFREADMTDISRLGPSEKSGPY